jgi:hypothetical protein
METVVVHLAAMDVTHVLLEERGTELHTDWLTCR